MYIEKNKENAIAFYKTAFEGNPRSAVEQYAGKKYIQHNPHVVDGTVGFTFIVGLLIFARDM